MKASRPLKVTPELLHRWTRITRDILDAIFYNHRIPCKPPHLRIEAVRNRLGAYDAVTRTIYLSEVLFLANDFDRIVETLKHECAHLVADELLGGGSETPHGSTFREACRKLGATPRAFVEKFDHIEYQYHQEAVVQESSLQIKIRKLLALSSSMNVHEAEAAMAKARLLMARHNLTAGEAAQDVHADYHYRQLGRAKGRHPVQEVLIANLLTDYFFVESIFVPACDIRKGKRGSILEILGHRENIEMAAYVYHFLTYQCGHFWQTYKVSRNLRGQAAKRSYIYGLLQGFRQKLEDQSQSMGRELVWVGSKPLKAFVRYRHPRVSRSSQGGRQLWREAYNQGRQDGRSMSFHHGVAEKKGKRLLLG